MVELYLGVYEMLEVLFFLWKEEEKGFSFAAVSSAGPAYSVDVLLDV